MNGNRSLDAPDFLVPKDQQTELEMADYAAEMAIRDRDVLRKASEAFRITVTPKNPSDADKVALIEKIIEYDRECAQRRLRAQNSAIVGRCRAVLDVLKDGLWHSTVDLCGPKTGSEGLRRLRELRSKGFVIVKRRKKDSTQYEYRLIK